MKGSARRADCHGCRNAGVSLVETLIAIVIISIALTAVSKGLFGRIGQSADYLWQIRALHLAQSYLDDSLSLAYQEDSPLGGGSVGSCVISGPDSGENRRDRFDDVDDYNGLTETGSFLDNGVRSDYSLYQVNIQVSCADSAGNASNSSKLVQVLIQGPGSLQLYMAAVRGDF